MITLTLDIETLPADDSLRGEIEAGLTPPGNISRPERIRQWESEERPGAVEEQFRKTALRGHAGRILCIGYIKEAPTETTEGVLTGDEPSILAAFWDLVRDVDLFVGFNVLGFDLKYIWQRSVVHGVKPSREISFVRFRSDPVYDVMQEWEKWGMNPVSLDTLSKALGVTSPKEGELDGSKVYDFYREGRVQEIYDYCLEDVKATRAIYRKMNFLP